jgi:hypothetical protein
MVLLAVEDGGEPQGGSSCFVELLYIKMPLFGFDNWGFFEFINSRSIHFYREIQEYGMFRRIKF